MPLEYIRNAYDLPKLKQGLRIKYNGQKGRITSFPMAYIRIQLDNHNSYLLIHPKDENLEIFYD